MLLCIALCFSTALFAQRKQIVDRIVATIEGEPVMASELDELRKFQQLLGGPAVAEKDLMRRRAEQWIIAADAQASRFPRPAAADVDKELARLAAQFASPDAYAARLRELELRAESVKHLVGQQLYFSRYLDARFRPTVQVEERDIEAYYRNDLARQMAARGQQLPPLDTVREQIRELLTQRQISERAGRWLDENRERLRIIVHGGKD